MTEFDEEKFDEKYVYYFEELEAAYSNAYQTLHGNADSTILKAIDRQVLSESEPVYEGDGQFRIELPDEPKSLIGDLQASEAAFDELLERFVELVEKELHEQFEFDNETS